MKKLIVVVAGIFCTTSALSGAFTTEEAAKRDNKIAWANIQRLRAPAWELSSMFSDYSPAYALYRDKASCTRDMQRLKAIWQGANPIAFQECHLVTPHMKASEFWSLQILTDDSATKVYTEIRFKEHESCLKASMNGSHDPNLKSTAGDSFKDFGGMCVNYGTKAPVETGE